MWHFLKIYLYIIRLVSTTPKPKLIQLIFFGFPEVDPINPQNTGKLDWIVGFELDRKRP